MVREKYPPKPTREGAAQDTEERHFREARRHREKKKSSTTEPRLNLNIGTIVFNFLTIELYPSLFSHTSDVT